MASSTLEPLSPDQLYRSCDLSGLGFETTDTLKPVADCFGQKRAVEALNFGVNIDHEGYNLYVSGSTGVGKSNLVDKVIRNWAREADDTSDWCYVNNFDSPYQPKALKLPRHRGQQLRRDMLNLVEQLLTALPQAFHSDEYRSRLQEIQDTLQEKEEANFSALNEKAKTRNVALLRTPHGYTLGPLIDGELVDNDAFTKLPEEKQKEIREAVEAINEELKQTIQKIPQLQEEERQNAKVLNDEFTQKIIRPFLESLKQDYESLPEVLSYLDAVHQDLLENVSDFLKSGNGENSPPKRKLALSHEFARYRVNVLVDNDNVTGAPVVYEPNPTYQNLMGRLEHTAHMGTLVTDFSLIKPGAIHRANGGYLILDTRRLLTAPFAWEGLKRVLRARQLKMESIEQVLSLATTTTLDSEPIPINIKVILCGDRNLYYLLKAYDPEFNLLFKVTADFYEELNRTEETTASYAHLIATLAQQEKTRPFHVSGVERLIEHGARLISDAEKLSLHMATLTDLVREADFWASQAESAVVRGEHVEKTIDNRIYLMDQYRELTHEQIEQNILLIDTAGEHIGQANGLSVIQLGDYAFGRPTRITATARLGNGKLVDIERETELGGPIHSKGVMILSAFLANRFAQKEPLSLAATLVMEQSYGQVEGDSASALELCTLMSAIARIPLKQCLAATGSVNQHGGVQAIGGVNEKIEGFFDICNSRGLTGDQGVIIPVANQRHLMLKSAVVDACKAGRFHIWAVATIDQMLALLSGLEAGEANADGIFPDDSFNGRVQSQLQAMSKRISRLNREAKQETLEEEEGQKENRGKHAGNEDNGRSGSHG